MRYLIASLFLACAACTVSRDPNCELDLSAAGFVTELTHAQATHRTPAFDDYTKGSYHVQMATLLDAVRAERSRQPEIRALAAVGPFGPMWQFNIALFLSEDDGLRSTILAMPHARITWKATQHVEQADFDALASALESATTVDGVSDGTSLLFVRWTSTGEVVRTSRSSLYGEPSEELSVALDLLNNLGEGAITTYSNDLGEDVKIYRCPPR